MRTFGKVRAERSETTTQRVGPQGEERSDELSFPHHHLS
ncbi:Uncharacterized protein YR821_1618 [Yersinia ruckeri]|uniref:Uncharacterized protein n=1 Tax=Yersinia ruckeri TaxID=29486 RepID=A0A0A8VIJ9_YERRU|nr:Uncharacterized protein YR821_1618 [Yersinia ruckeri]CEK27441.1 hypothetical protein CSF007_8435 [Yersinia ruckeri]